MFLWRNLFAHRTPVDEHTGFYRGFYVESGANDFKKLSNTYFFDKCLGWRGLCVEPLPQYHAGLRANRSCELAPECISKVAGSEMRMDAKANIGAAGRTGRVEEPGSRRAGSLRVNCNPLDVMLKASRQQQLRAQPRSPSLYGRRASPAADTSTCGLSTWRGTRSSSSTARRGR